VPVTKDEAIKLLKHLGAQRVTVGGNGWIKSTCPFARWHHSGGTDSDPSFGVNLKDGFGYNCFSCSQKGKDPQGLVWKLRALAGGGYGEAMGFLSGIDLGQASKLYNKGRTPFGLKGKAEVSHRFTSAFDGSEGATPIGTPQALFESEVSRDRATMPEERLEDFKTMYHPYLLGRGFTKATIERWELMVDVDGLGNERIVFPIRNKEGELLAFSRRVTWDAPRCQWCGYTDPPGTPKDKRTIRFGSRRKSDDPADGGCPNCQNKWVWPKYLHSKGFHRNHYLYGEHLTATDCKKGVLCEGNLDPVRLDQAGVINPVASLGTKIGTGWPTAKDPGEQLYWLTQLFDELVVVPDPDEAGRGMAELIQRHMRGREDLMWVQIAMPPRTDPGGMTDEEIRDLLEPYGVMRA
jgi:hypothetical protein